MTINFQRLVGHGISTGNFKKSTLYTIKVNTGYKCQISCTTLWSEQKQYIRFQKALTIVSFVYFYSRLSIFLIGTCGNIFAQIE